jgi:nucleoside-diphosphate-sugar epimerase
LLGYDPKTKIEDGIPRFVEWFEESRQSSVYA